MDETISASVWNGGEVTETKQDIIMSANVKQEPAEESEGDVGHAVPYGELEITYEPDIKTHRETVSGASNSHPIASSSLKRDKSVVASKWIQKDINTGWRRRVACNICKKTFAKLWNLKVHERIHTGEKPFECNICMKTFNRKSDLKRHKRIHSKEIPSNDKVCMTDENLINVTVKQELAEESEGDVGHAIPYGDIDIHEPDIKQECERASRENYSQRSSDASSNAEDYAIKANVKQEPAEEEVECDGGYAIPYGDIDIHEPDIKLECERRSVESDFIPVASSSSKCGRSVLISNGIQEKKHVDKPKRKYCCNICMKTFTKLYNLKAHTRVHTGERPFACNICMKKFGHESHLNRHKRIHLKENSFGDQASTTTEKLRMNANVKQESAEEAGEGDVVHAVPYGDIEITYEPDFKMERERASGESNSISVASTSSKCDRSVAISKGIKKSLKIGGRRHTCNVCMKSFTRAAHLSDHERIHTGEKPFECKVCMKTFSRLPHLTDHERIHTGDKPFACSICMKTFTQASHLNRHERSHTGDKPFECNICQKKFTQTSSLKIHKRIHVRGKT